MILVKNPTTGEWIQVAGNGKAEYGASTVRSGTFVYSLTDNVPISKTIAFDSAMPDSDYLLEIDTGSSKVSCGNITKSASGFTCFLRNNDSAEVAGRTFSYTAFKLYTDTEYNSLLEDVAKLTGVTSGTGARNTTHVNSENFIANWYKVGRICTVDIQYTLSQATSSDIELITGLPKPIVQIACVGEGNNNTNVSDFVIKTNGAIRTHYNGAEGQFMHGTATYITAD